MALALGLLYWILEAAVHVFILRDGYFTQHVFTTDGHEIWKRLLVIALLLGFGISIQVVLRQRRRAERELAESHQNLEKQVEERTSELTAQTAKLATTRERERLARELHDSVSQTLYSASLIAEATPRIWERDPEEGRRRLDEMRLIMRGAMAQMRTLLLELRPAALARGDLGDLLQQLAESIGGPGGSPVGVEINGNCTLPVEAKVALYRIAQEAMNNAVKHAGGDRVELSLSCRNGRVELSIRDEGQGFEPETVPAGGMGLGIMRERAESSGATFAIESRPGQGTRVTAIWSQAPDES